MKKSHHGFVALISVIIISVVLLATTLSLAQFGIASRYFILDLENKSVSEKLAEACVHVARISVFNDPLYAFTNAHPVVVPVDTTTCTIISITPHGNESIIETQGTRNNSVTNLIVTVNNTDGSYISWSEVPVL